MFVEIDSTTIFSATPLLPDGTSMTSPTLSSVKNKVPKPVSNLLLGSVDTVPVRVKLFSCMVSQVKSSSASGSFINIECTILKSKICEEDIVKSTLLEFSIISSVSVELVDLIFSPFVNVPVTLIRFILVLVAVSIKPVAPEDTPVIFAPTVVPPDGVSLITNSVNILISNKFILYCESESAAVLIKFVTPLVSASSSIALTLAFPILVPALPDGKREPGSVPLAAKPPLFAIVKLSCNETSLYGFAISPDISGVKSGI